MNFSKDSKVTRLSNAVAAGATDVNGSSVDMQNYENVTFIAMLGALTLNQVTQMKAQQSDDNSTFNDLLGTQTPAMADNDDNQCIILEIAKPRERYVRPVLERATANAVIDGIIAIQTGPLKKPTTHDATTVQATETHVSPAEGTA